MIHQMVMVLNKMIVLDDMNPIMKRLKVINKGRDVSISRNT